MTRVRRINVSQVDGNGANNSNINEIRPYGEVGLYVGDNNKLELLMFDGVRTHVQSKVLNKGTFYGGDADSSDELGYDTIKLVPDEVLRRNGSDQYLVIDPTNGEPGHIHIRAGGTIDSSNADLFLGGEKNNVRVSDTNDRVTITTDAGFDNITRTWTFDANGDLVFPGATSKIGEDEPGLVVFSNNGFAILTNANTTSSQSWIFDNDGALRLPGNATVENTETVLAAGTIITVPLNAAGDTEDYVGGASVLEVPTNEETDQVQAGWIITFSNNQQRTVTSTGQAGGYTSIYYADANPGLGSNTYPLTIQSADYNAGSNGNVTISLTNINNSTTSLVLSGDGSLVLPSNLNIIPTGNFAPVNGTFITQAPGEYLGIVSTGDGGGTQLGWSENILTPGRTAALAFNAGNAGDVDIITGDYTGTVYTWIFRANGILELPGGGEITSNEITNEVFGTTTTSLTLVPAGATDPGQRLEIYSTIGGEGNHLHLTSGSTSTELYLGNDSQYVKLGSSGEIEVSAQSGLILRGEGAESYSYLVLPNNVDSSSTMVTLNNSNGDVLIRSANPDDPAPQQWSFGKDGSLTVPGNIKAIASVGSDGNDLTVQAGETVGGNGGDLTLKSGETATGNGGDLDIIAGDTITGNGGNISITAGTTLGGGSGGSVTITAGGNTANDAGNINLVAGTSTSGNNGNISLTSAAGAWTFGADGNVTFPSGSDITFDNSATSYVYGITGVEFADNTTQTTAWTGAYTPATPSDWAGTPPTTIAEALNRLAARIKLIDGGTGA